MPERKMSFSLKLLLYQFLAFGAGDGNIFCNARFMVSGIRKIGLHFHHYNVQLHQKEMNCIVVLYCIVTNSTTFAQSRVTMPHR